MSNADEDFFNGHDMFGYDDGMDKLLSEIDESTATLPPESQNSSRIDVSPNNTSDKGNDVWVQDLMQRLQDGVKTFLKMELGVFIMVNVVLR